MYLYLPKAKALITTLLLSFLSIFFLVVVTVIFPQTPKNLNDGLYYLKNYFLNNNFNAVVAGEVFRSAEMPLRDLAELIDREKIRTIVDLRLSGARVQANGESEDKIVAEKGAQYFHFPLSSSRVMTAEELRALKELFAKLEKPILFHCSGGANRAGVVSAIWLLEVGKADYPTALQQMTLRYGMFLPERWFTAWWNKRAPIEATLLPELFSKY